MILAVVFSAISKNQNLLAQSDIIGIWLTQDKEANVQIYTYSGKCYGKIVWLKTAAYKSGILFKDINNPVESLKKRQLMNLVILNDFTYSDNEWTDGTIYDPTDGSTYDCKIWLEDYNTMKVRGFWGFMYETETWTRTRTK